MFPLDVLLLAPASRKVALANGEVGVSLNVTETVNVESVLLAERSIVEHTESVVRLGSIGVGEEQETR